MRKFRQREKTLDFYYIYNILYRMRSESKLTDLLTNKPLFRQIADILADQIRRGHYPVGTKFPSLQKLGAELEVSYMTIQKAVSLLRQQGYLLAGSGKLGTIVACENPSTKQNSMRLLGVFVRRTRNHTSYDNFGNDLIYSIYREITARGFYQSTYCPDDASAMGQFADAVDNRLLDAIILDNHLADRMLDDLVKTGLPIILFDSECSADNVWSVVPDYAESARVLAAHVVESGRYSSYKFLHNVTDEYGKEHRDYFLRESWHAYRDAILSLTGQEVDGMESFEENFFDNGDAYLDSILEDRHCGVWVISEYIFNLMRERASVRELDEFCGLAGARDLYVNREKHPNLSSWRLSPEHFGSIIAQTVDAVVKNHNVPKVTKFALEWIDRGSI